MIKIKEFWGKLEYWQKGAVIGIVLGIISFLIGATIQYILPKLDPENPVFIFAIFPLYLGIIYATRILHPLSYNMSEDGFINIVSIVGSIIGILLYTLIGTLIGFIIGKIKKK